MPSSHLATFLTYLQSDYTEFQIAQRSYFMVSFGFPNGTPSFEQNVNMPKYFKGTEDRGTTKFPRQFLPFLVQGVDLPKLSVSGGAKGGEGYSIINFEGQAKGPGKFLVLPDGAKSVDIKFLDTESPVFENYFYPWMNEVTAFENRDGNRPFARADIYVDLLSNDLRRITQTYKITGAYPNSIELPELKQVASQTPVRTVSFDFNNIILSNTNGVIFNNNQVLPADFVRKICKEIDSPYAKVIENDINNRIDRFQSIKTIAEGRSSSSSDFFVA